jgi:hypothetical protein
MKAKMLQALRARFEGEIASHKMNVEVYLENPAGIGEHPDIIEAVEQELAKLAEADEKLATLEKYWQ